MPTVLDGQEAEVRQGAIPVIEPSRGKTHMETVLNMEKSFRPQPFLPCRE